MAEKNQELDASDLLAFLEIIEEHLPEQITLVAAGGTALTLLNAKPSTIDIDFTGPTASIAAFEQAASTEAHGYDIDTWPDGTVFMVNLPDDYLGRSSLIETGLARIELRALHPVDLIVTKIARCDARDRDDIRRTREMFEVSVAEVEDRVSAIVYVGSEDAYDANLEAALRTCFDDR